MKEYDDKANDIFRRLTLQGQKQNISEAQTVVQPTLQGSAPTITPTRTNPEKVMEKQLLQKKPIRSRNLDENIDPNSLDDFDEQLKVVEDKLISSIKKGTSESTIRCTYEWIDGIIDEDTGKLYPNMHEALSSLSKDELVNYVEMLLSSCM